MIWPKPDLRLLEYDLETINQAAEIDLFTHPSDTMKLVAEVRWLRQQLESNMSGPLSTGFDF